MLLHATEIEMWEKRALYSMGHLQGSAVGLLDADFVIRWSSPSFRRIFGYDPTGVSALKLLHPDDLCYATKVLRDFHDQERQFGGSCLIDEIPPAAMQMRVIHRDGRWLECSISLESRLEDPEIASLVIRLEHTPDQSGMGRALGLLAEAAPTPQIVETILDYVRADRLRELREETYVVWWDDDGWHVSASTPGVTIDHPLVAPSVIGHGISTDGPVGTRVCDLPPGLTRAVAESQGFTTVWTVAIGEPGAAPVGAVIVWSASSYDLELRPELHITTGVHLLRITLLEAQRRRVMFLAANTDQLTGLRNRSGLRSALDDAARHGGFPLTALFVDLDHFKQVNDTLGHEAGDLVLATVASRLKRICTSRDVVVRLGGDEFVILRPFSVDIDIANLLTKIAEDLTCPISLDSLGHGTRRMIDIGASIGVATAYDEGGLLDLLSRADKALYQAKGARDLN